MPVYLCPHESVSLFIPETAGEGEVAVDRLRSAWVIALVVYVALLAIPVILSLFVVPSVFAR